MKQIIFAVMLAGVGVAISPAVASADPCPPGAPMGDGGVCHVWRDGNTGALKVQPCVTNLFMTCGAGRGIWEQATDGSWFRTI